MQSLNYHMMACLYNDVPLDLDALIVINVTTSRLEVALYCPHRVSSARGCRFDLRLVTSSVWSWHLRCTGDCECLQHVSDWPSVCLSVCTSCMLWRTVWLWGWNGMKSISLSHTCSMSTLFALLCWQACWSGFQQDALRTLSRRDYA